MGIGLVESARRAGEHGVTLALQSHAPVIGDYQDVLRMVGEVHEKARLATEYIAEAKSKRSTAL